MTAKTHTGPTGGYEQGVATKLRGCLAEKRLTNRDLARRLGRTDFWIGRRANGQTPISVGELIAIADVLGEPLERFLPTPPITDDRNRSTREYSGSTWVVDALHPRLQGETADTRANYALAA
jgi:transcriptional regulator with XRE-family HTH domain